MSYCTTTDLIRRYGESDLIQLTDRDGFTGAIVSDEIEAAQATAEAEIDGYLRDGGYDLPLAAIPQALIRHAVQLTYFYLFVGPRTQEAQADYTASQNWLARIAAGKEILPFPRTGEVAAIGSPAISTGSTVFSDDRFSQFIRGRG